MHDGHGEQCIEVFLAAAGVAFVFEQRVAGTWGELAPLGYLTRTQLMAGCGESVTVIDLHHFFCGQIVFDVIDKQDFLRQDDAGQYYWNDEFMFETDPTSTMMANREAMWQQIDMKLQSGAFGQLGSLETMRLYWSLMEKNHYPNAGDVLGQIEQMMQEQQAMQEQMQQQGGMMNEMPGMPTGVENSPLP